MKGTGQTTREIFHNDNHAFRWYARPLQENFGSLLGDRIIDTVG